MRNRNCRECGKSTTHYKYCGSVVEQTGCAFKIYRTQVRNHILGYRKNSEFRKNTSEYYKKWYEKNGRKRNPLAQSAHRKVREATERGELIRPNNCENCKTECKPEAHHPDYSKPLEVEWLCNLCHRKIHPGTIKRPDFHRPTFQHEI